MSAIILRSNSYEIDSSLHITGNLYVQNIKNDNLEKDLDSLGETSRFTTIENYLYRVNESVNMTGIVSGPAARRSHMMFTVNERSFLLGGSGSGTLLTDLYEWDVTARRLILRSSTMTTLRNAAMCEFNGTVFVFGGEFNSGHQPSSVNVFVLETLSWATKGITGMAPTLVLSPLVACDQKTHKMYTLGGTDVGEDPVDTVQSLTMHSNPQSFAAESMPALSNDPSPGFAYLMHSSPLRIAYLNGHLGASPSATTNILLYDGSSTTTLTPLGDAMPSLTGYATVEWKNLVYLIGGKDYAGNDNTEIRKIQFSNSPMGFHVHTVVSGGTFQPYMFSKLFAAPTQLPNFRDFVVFGGFDEDSDQDVADMYTFLLSVPL
eukprot:CAMPEP_0117446116 /NCGR_PEP_ID=MMETSP0759-20121206/6159_1 /TAXON_ID=63605 /ORGANISM="Percolomonas cosmopolitus, Strain WS" /LENGTH=375 /DNA_ID=CAMNT_0005238341 /DNA_START=213 /DNA_END=1340 /DNA_ORIENTATION=+